MRSTGMGPVLMVKSGGRYRLATAAEVFEAAGQAAREAFNRERPTLADPADAHKYLTAMYRGRDYESFGVVFLDLRYRALEFKEMFRGTIDRATVHPREIAKECLWLGAASVLLAHNHPSGVMEPSKPDEWITREVKAALELIQVKVLDHILVGNGHCFSFSQHGLL